MIIKYRDLIMLVNIHEAKTNFSKLIKLALNGEEVIIAKDGTPLICLTPYTEQIQKRQGGQLKDLLHIAEDFDAPLPPESLNGFYSREI